MRKLFIIASTVLSFFSLDSFGQNAYDNGDKIVNLGLSLGYYGNYHNGNRDGGFVPFVGSFELGVHEYLSVGPYLGFGSWKYRYRWGGGPSVFNYTYSVTALEVGARGVFHYLPLLNQYLQVEIDEGHFDFYIPLLLGLRFVSYRWDDWDDNFGDEPYDNDVRLAFGPALGFKYLFTPNIGVYLEGGITPLGYASLGLSAKF